ALSIAAGWIGLLAIVATVVFVTPAVMWPGYAAALPTFGAAAIIASGYTQSGYGIGKALGNRFFIHVGALSYSIYLWHWPVIEIARAEYGAPSGMLRFGLVLVSYVLAWLTYRLVENPIRHSKAMQGNARYALSAGLNFTMLGILSASVLMIAFLYQAKGAPDTLHAVGAAVLKGKARNNPAGKPVDSVDWMTPEPAMATDDV